MDQLTDPKTGMLHGERTPTLNMVDDDDAQLDAIGKGFKGMACNCGEVGHMARDCTKAKVEQPL